MKTSLKLFAIATLIFAAPYFASATVPNTKATLKTGMYFSKDGKLNVFVENKSPKGAKVVVKDTHNQIVLEQRTARSVEVSGLKIDMDALPDGHYIVEVSNEKEKVAQAVQLDTPAKERRIVAGK